MRNKRVSIRKQPSDSIAVIDTNTTQTLGNLANLSTGGLMLIGSISSAPGTLFQLQMQLAVPTRGISSLEFGVESLWCQRARDTCSYWTGFQIIDISQPTSEAIDTLLLGWQ